METEKKSWSKRAGFGFLAVLMVLLVYRLIADGIFSKKIGMNIAVVGDKGVSLLMIRPEEDFIGWIDFPENLKVKIYNSSASYPVNSLWEYGVVEKKPFEVVSKTLGQSMGVVIPRTVKLRNYPSMTNLLANLHKVSLKTDLSLRDRVMIRKYVSAALMSKKTLEMEIPKNAYEKIIEPDGKEFLSFGAVVILWTKNKFVVSSILNENVEVVVNNMTEQSGLGVLYSKQLESAGLRVVEVKSDNSIFIDGTGCLYASNGEYPYTEELLIKQMECHKIEPQKQDGLGEGIAVYIK